MCPYASIVQYNKEAVSGLVLKKFRSSKLNWVKLNVRPLLPRILFRALVSIFAVICHCLDLLRHLSARRLWLIISSLYSRSHFRILFHSPLPLCKGRSSDAESGIGNFSSHPRLDLSIFCTFWENTQRVKQVPTNMCHEAPESHSTR